MNRAGSHLRVGLIGYGGIGRTVAALADEHDGIEIVAVLVRAVPLDPIGAVPFVADLAALREARCDIVAECAGHATVRTHLPPLLASGIDCVVASVGALADREVESALTQAAQSGEARLIVPAGAVGGIDLIAAARVGGLTRVTYQSRKPPRAWLGTRAETLVDLARLTDSTAFFRGTARQAALGFPQNANVAATIALAGLGFDRTEVELYAVPDARDNRHAIQVEGAFGTASIEIAGRPLPNNPKTSYLAAVSVMRALTNAAAHVVI